MLIFYKKCIDLKTKTHKNMYHNELLSACCADGKLSYFGVFSSASPGFGVSGAGILGYLFKRNCDKTFRSSPMSDIFIL